MKRTLLTILGVIVLAVVLVALAGMYKFNYLANQPGYDVDGNKIDYTISGIEFDDFTIAETFESACTVDADCALPHTYAIRSSCPYESKCIENRCAVICPRGFASADPSSDQGVTIEDVRCQLDSFGDSGAGVEVPVSVVHGAEVVDHATANFRGYDGLVVYNTGSEFEPQTFLNMIIEKDGTWVAYATMYDYYPEEKAGPINVLHYDGEDERLRLQCWVE